MTKTAETVLAICFLLYYLYYTILGFAFGELVRIKSHHYPYVALTIVGLILINTSLITVSDVFTCL